MADKPTTALYLHMSWSRSEGAIRRIIPAAREWGYDALVLEIGGNVVLDAQNRRGSSWSKDDIRSLLALAEENGLQVIPCADLLGHTDCIPRMPEFVDKDMGFKLWEPGVYEFIEDYVAEVCELFEGPAYFHARLDEASKALNTNSERLGVPTAELLAQHVTRVNEIVRKQGAQLIIYHDMLLPMDQGHVGTASGGPPLNSWTAVDSIPRDIVINFWLYQFSPANAPAVEFFTRRGFEVWVSPWHTPEPMAAWAAEQDMPVIQTTWCDPTTLASAETILRAVVMAPLYRNDPAAGSKYELGYSPLLRGVQALMNEEPQIEGSLSPIALPPGGERPAGDAATQLPETVEFGGATFTVDPIILHQPTPSLDDRLESAKPPLTLVRSDGVEHVVNGVNRGRGEAEIILYTPAFGSSTGANMFGGEMVVVDGIVQDLSGDMWSNCGYLIPPGGCVISGHCSRDVPGFLTKFRKLDAVRLVDADGTALFGEPKDDTSLVEGITVPVPAGGPVREVWLLHATLGELPATRIDGKRHMPVVGQAIVNTDDGSQAFEMTIGQELSSWRVPRRLLTQEDRQPNPKAFLAWSADHGYGDVRCLWATRLQLDQPTKISAIELKPTVAGMAAGWMIAAAGVVR